ncbi:MAG: exosome complex RNA-binding protein Rrp4 [archaeon]
MLKVEDKQLVTPGEIVAEGSDYLAGTGIYRDGPGLYASRLGLIEVRGNFVKLIPLAGRYMPQTNDYIIGIIQDTMLSSWIVNINSPYEATLPLSSGSSSFIEKGEELTRYYDVGDVIFCQVMNVTKSKQIGVSMRSRGLRKLYGGRIVEISSTKVPRLIGKNGTMVTMIKSYTNSDILVGQNGRVWVRAPPETENIVVQAIMKIDSEAHISGLTDRIKTFLEKNVPKSVVQAVQAAQKAVEAPPVEMAKPPKPSGAEDLPEEPAEKKVLRPVPVKPKAAASKAKPAKAKEAKK